MLCRTTRCIALLAILICLFVSSQPAVVLAGTGIWISTGPEGGPISALAIDPATPTTLYAGTADGRVFKSTDGAATWAAPATRLNDGKAYIYALAIDPTTPATLYAGTSVGLYKSTDGGAHWHYISPVTSKVLMLAIDPATSATLYAGTDGSVYKSTDGGAHWRDTDLPLGDVRALAIDPENPTTIYAGSKTACTRAQTVPRIGMRSRPVLAPGKGSRL